MVTEAAYDQSILLKNLVPLNALSEEHLGQLVSRLDIERAAKGDFLFQEGDTDHFHVYLLEGRVDLLSGAREVDSVRSGTKTARFALAHHWPRKFSARAASDVRFVRIESRLLSELLVRAQSQSYRVTELAGDTGSDDWMSQVLRSKVLQQIPPSNIQNVLRRMEEVSVPAGEVVIRQGDEGDYYYVVIEGTCEVMRRRPGSEEERRVTVLGPGDCFGEEALVSGGSRGGTVTMLDDGLLMRLGKDDFAELIRQPLLQRIKRAEARELVERGAVWIDVRDPEAYQANHLDGAENMPLDSLREECNNYPQDRAYVVYGEDFSQSAIGAFLLRERGFEVWVLDGGLDAPEERPAAPTRFASQPAPVAADSAGQPAPSSAAGAEQRIEALEKQARETQARYHKALLQRVAEIRQLRQMLEAARAENRRLEQALKQAQAQGAAPESLSDPADAEELARLKERIAELQGELDEVQDVLQEASAEESTHHWERLRQQSRLEALQQTLTEQQEINRVLREENEETMRRLEAMRRELAATHEQDQ
jgi:CRP-like cAMP-binding protein